MERRISPFWLFVIATSIAFALHGMTIVLGLIDYRIGVALAYVLTCPVMWLFWRVPEIAYNPLIVVIMASVFWGFVTAAAVEWWPLVRAFFQWMRTP